MRSASTIAAASVDPPGLRRARCGWSRSRRPIIQSRRSVLLGSQEPRLKMTGTRPGAVRPSRTSRTNLIVRIDFPEPARPSITSRPEDIRR